MQSVPSLEVDHCKQKTISRVEVDVSRLFGAQSKHGRATHTPDAGSLPFCHLAADLTHVSLRVQVVDYNTGLSNALVQ